VGMETSRGVPLSDTRGTCDQSWPGLGDEEIDLAVQQLARMAASRQCGVIRADRWTSGHCSFDHVCPCGVAAPFGTQLKHDANSASAIIETTCLGHHLG
jgi:hypothetical protein